MPTDEESVFKNPERWFSTEQWNGMNWWEHLARLALDSKTDKSDTKFKQISDALESPKKLDTGYRLDSHIHYIVDENLLRPKNKKRRASTEAILSESDKQVKLFLRDKKGHPVRFDDVGSGVSQLIPVLVAIYYHRMAYAIQPSAFRGSMDLIHLLDKFGFHEGRFVASFPDHWVEMVNKHLDSLPDVEQSRARLYMNKLDKESLVPVGCNYEKLDDNELNSWVANAEKRFTEGVFNGVVFEEGSGRFPSIDDVWNDDSILVRSRDKEIAGNARAYAEIASRLIQASTEVILVDPYFTLAKPNRAKVLGEFIKIAQASKRCQNIEIISNDNLVTKREVNDEWFLKDCEKVLTRICTKDVAIRWKLVSDENAKIRLDDKDATYRMHPRYIVSLRGGLRFDKGFEEFADNQVVDISTLDKYKCNEVYNLYAENAAGFKTVCEVRWDGSRVSVIRPIPINN